MQVSREILKRRLAMKYIFYDNFHEKSRFSGEILAR